MTSSTEHQPWTASAEPEPADPSQKRQGPIVVDSDLGGDPDDLVALACAARSSRLELVVTSDETGGDRARLARRFLDLLGRGDVRVVAGTQLTEKSKYWVMDDEVDRDAPVDTAVLSRVLEVCWHATGPVTWVGLGPMSNYAAVVTAMPELADRLTVTQMGGWIDTYRDKSRASHNLRIDQRSAGLALRVAAGLRLVMSEHTNSPHIDIDLNHQLYRSFADSAAPWARLIARNYQRWFQHSYPHSWLGDPLTVAAALDEPVLDFRVESLRVAGDARLYREADGRSITVTNRVDYSGFRDWLDTQLDLSGMAAGPTAALERETV